MGNDAQVAHARIIGGDLLDRRWRARSAMALVDNVRDGVRGEGSALVSERDGAVERRGAVPVEQAQQPRRGAAEMSAVKRDLAEERLGMWARGTETVAPP